MLCSNSSFSLSQDSRSDRSLPRQLWSVASSWKPFFKKSFVFFPTLLSLLTIVKPLRCRLMRLAGYICPTTEEVACGVTRSRPPTKSSPPSFQATSTDSLQDSETGGHLCGDRRVEIMLLIFILPGRNIRDLETLKALESITVLVFSLEIYSNIHGWCICHVILIINWEIKGHFKHSDFSSSGLKKTKKVGQRGLGWEVEGSNPSVDKTRKEFK